MQTALPATTTSTASADHDAAAAGWALVDRAQAGDSKAFGEICDNHLDTVYRYVYYRIGVPDITDDLVAETFNRARKIIGRFTERERNPGAWLITVARRVVTEYRRSSRYHLNMSPNALDADEQDEADRATNAALLAAIKRLPGNLQECVVLRFLFGFTPTDTAFVMSESEETIRTWQYRAARTLRRHVPEGALS
jgi:RNA polymerase sigma-70 factor, ECF subfamily